MARMGEEERCRSCCGGNPEGKRPLGRNECTEENNAKNYRKERWSEGADCIYLAHENDCGRVFVSVRSTCGLHKTLENA